MKRPDYLDEELPAKIKVRHLTIEQKRVLRLKHSANFKQRWAKARGMVAK